MSKLYVLGDPHVTDTNVPLALQQRRMNYLLNLPARKGDVLVCLGDIHHTKSKLTPVQHWMLTQVLTNWAHKCETYVLQGNHDVASTRSDASHVEAIVTNINHPNLFYIREPGYLTFHSMPGVGALFIPWHWEQSTYVARAMATLNTPDPRVSAIYGFAHFGIQEFMYDNGRMEKHGVPAEMLASANISRMFVGHFHVPQVSIRHGLTIDYIGSAYDTAYIPRNSTRRGLAVIDAPGAVPRYLSPPADTNMVQVADEDAEEALRSFIENPTCMRVTAKASPLTKQALELDNHHLLVVREPPAPILNRPARLNLTPQQDNRLNFVCDAVRQYMELDNRPADFIEHVVATVEQLSPQVGLSADPVNGRVQLESVRLQNFMAHVDSTIHFKTGLWLLDGVNRGAYSSSVGAGKSSIIEAVKWALHGKLLRDGVPAAAVLRHSAPQGAGCRVTLRYAVSGRVSTLMRYRSDLSLGNVGVLVTSGDVSYDSNEAEDYILGSTGITDTVFRAAVCFGRATKQLITATGTAQRKEILANLTGASDLFAAWYDCIKSARAYKIAEATSLKESAIKTTTLLDDGVARLDKRKKEYDNWREVSMTAMDSIHKTRDAAAKALGTANHRLRRLKQAAEAATKRLQAADAAMVEAKRELAAANSQLSFHQRVLANTTVCPKCGYTTEDQDAVNLAIRTTKDTIQLLRDAESKCEASAATAKTVRWGYLANVERQQAHVQEIFAAFTDANAKLEAHQSVTNPYSDYVDIENDINELREKAADLTAKEKETRVEIETLDYLANVTGANGLPVLIVEQAMPAINDEANRILQLVTGGALQVALVTRQGGGASRHQHVDLSVLNARGANHYSTSSDGEQHLESFAIALAAAKYANRCNLLFIDELFDNVDSVVASKMLEVCAAFAEENDLCLMATTHKDELKPDFPNVITVENDGQGVFIRNET